MPGKGKGIEMTDLEKLLEKSSEGHIHLCPRQVLGARMGLYAGELLGLDLPQDDKRLMVIVETDGCMLDGVGAATGCSPGGGRCGWRITARLPQPSSTR
jgi:formylmethanofuran dehydrogenase subunit E